MPTGQAIPEFDIMAAGPRRLVGVRNQAGGAVYEGASKARRTAGWQAPTASANANLGSLATLRDRSRAAARNDGYAKSAIDALVRNIIGTGIKPLSQAPDPAVREAIHRTFLAWTDQCDADGQLDFYGLQTQATRAWLEGGDAFTRARSRRPEDGLVVPLQLQVLEPELVPHTYNDWGKRIRAGIQFSPLGQRVAYHFHPTRPEFDDFDAATLVAVPATRVAHMYDPLRPGQLRGLPILTQALVALHELSKYSDAVLLRQQIGNLFAGFVKRSSPSSVAEELHPLTGQPLAAADDGQPFLQLEPGLMQELGDGEEVQFSDPPNADGYGDFMRQKLHEAAVACNVPYELLTGDMSKVNDRTVRVITNEFRRRIQAWQHQVVVFQLNRRVYRWWMDAAWYAGALPLPDDYIRNPEPWLAVKWIPQGWPYQHPVQDVQAAESAVRSGFRSRQSVVAELGEDAEVIDAEQAADAARADGLGLRYDSDGRYPKNSSTPAPATDDTDPPPAPEQASDLAGASR